MTQTSTTQDPSNPTHVPSTKTATKSPARPFMAAAFACLAAAGMAFGQGTCDAAKACSASEATAMAQGTCQGDQAQAGQAPTVTLASLEAAQDGTIVEVAQQAGQFKTLLAAAQAAGLAEALSSSGPFTVFAPTDEAFNKLGKATIDNLLKPENRQTLRAILAYHVVRGEMPAQKVLAANDAATLNGQRIDFSMRDGAAYVDNAKILATDVEASNGVIHVIDSVLLPETKNLAELAVADGRFTILAKAIEAAGLAEALTGDQPLTVFAPTDEAFNKLPAGTLEQLLKPESRQTLRKILTYHVVPGRVYARDAVAAQRARTLEGSPVRIDIQDGRLTINGANVINSDVEASNGVIHVIDTVILPES